MVKVETETRREERLVTAFIKGAVCSYVEEMLLSRERSSLTSLSNQTLVVFMTAHLVSVIRNEKPKKHAESSAETRNTVL